MKEVKFMIVNLNLSPSPRLPCRRILFAISSHLTVKHLVLNRERKPIARSEGGDSYENSFTNNVSEHCTLHAH
jgi:hypothetical protein